jgi:hypothetical protein
LTNGEVGRIFTVRRATKPLTENFPAFLVDGRIRVDLPPRTKSTKPDERSHEDVLTMSHEREHLSLFRVTPE